MGSVYVAVEISLNFQSIKPEFEAENMLKIYHFLTFLLLGTKKLAFGQKSLFSLRPKNLSIFALNHKISQTNQE